MTSEEVSAWSVWLHPRRYARECARLLDERETVERNAAASRDKAECLTRELGEARGEISRMEEAQKSLAETNDKLAESNKVLFERIGQLEAEAGEAKAELAERKDTETQIREFEEVLSRVKEMKERYEKRIERLRTMVKEARREAGHRDSEEYEMIDMTGNGTQQPPAPRRSAQSAPDPEPDWLETLP